jgi:26S proteasome regulatory subunit T1
VILTISVDKNKYQIQIALRPKIDPTVTLMQVEEKPDVTYEQVGGMTDELDQLREVSEIITFDY